VNANTTTVEKLKSSETGAVGRVLTTGHYLYMVVEETPKGVRIVDLDKVLANGYPGSRSQEIPSSTEVWVENRQ
jgi:hypothetical protein